MMFIALVSLMGHILDITVLAYAWHVIAPEGLWWLSQGQFDELKGITWSITIGFLGGYYSPTIQRWLGM